jgi:RNA-directed DNA polymerase
LISPLLANIYLHHGFDKWMEQVNPQNPFERYADDIVIHCNNKEEAEQLLMQLGLRMQAFKLTLHPEKTKIVYCKNYQRTDSHQHESFSFPGECPMSETLRADGSPPGFVCWLDSA